MHKVINAINKRQRLCQLTVTSTLSTSFFMHNFDYMFYDDVLF